MLLAFFTMMVLIDHEYVYCTRCGRRILQLLTVLSHCLVIEFVTLEEKPNKRRQRRRSTFFERSFNLSRRPRVFRMYISRIDAELLSSWYEKELCERPEGGSGRRFRVRATGRKGRIEIESEWTARKRARRGKLCSGVELSYSSQRA